jgi:peptide deformylase
MPLREILKYPDPRLRQVSAPIERITPEVRALAAEMLEVMYAEPGIGLAAPQLGEPVRLIVMDTVWTEEGAERSPLVVLNPEILEREGTLVWTEGCLSVPDFQAEVERAARVRVRGLDLEGAETIHEAEGLRSVCFQHEIDHLDGRLFIDRISPLKRELYAQRRRKALRREAEEGRPPSRAGDLRL